jgi:glycosyltransferase involved in cell wall biosynthesis
LPSKPRPEFVETFGIALAEKLLVGGLGPVITTRTGGIPEAVGDAALFIEAGSPLAIEHALNKAVFELSTIEKRELADRGRRYALRFDRQRVFGEILERLSVREAELTRLAG